MIQVFILSTPLALLTLINTSTNWIFKAWFKAFISLILLQVFIVLILIVMLSLDNSNKILLIGSIYALVRANNYIREIFGGINVDVSGNISSFVSNFKH